MARPKKETATSAAPVAAATTAPPATAPAADATPPPETPPAPAASADHPPPLPAQPTAGNPVFVQLGEQLGGPFDACVEGDSIASADFGMDEDGGIGMDEDDEDMFDLQQMAQLLLTEDGVAIADVLQGTQHALEGIRLALDKHCKILFKAVQLLERKG